jgi:two-component system CheB/CheR fusion protein
MDAQNNTLDPPAKDHFHIVGVGASAGGLDSFKKFLSAVEPGSGMAYVLVQHLSPNHDSLLPELLSRVTNIPVHEITDDVKILADNVYIIPENKILLTVDGSLKLEPRESTSKPNMPIDIFFNSLAETHRSFAIGVVLSGAGLDGTHGLKSIREMGGSTFAQDPETASFESMPQSAIKSETVDFVLAPENIPGQLLHIRNAYQTNHAYREDETLPKSDEEIFRQILRTLRTRTGNDFSHYKQATIRRRIARRMVLTKREEPVTYLAFLRTDKSEQDALFNDILIPVSYFFRDSKTFDALKQTIFPLLVKNNPPGEKIRIWSAGCSTGEEPYSLAMSIQEYLTENQLENKVQIFASDISENVIAKARAGIYSKQDLENLSETRIQNFFTKSAGSYAVNKSIRDMCVFAVHNFLKDPPFAKLDLVSCRNVLIYLDPSLQTKALTTFHYALKDNGTLLLGKSETTGTTSLFTSLIKNEKVYARKPSPGHFIPSVVNRAESVATEKLLMIEKVSAAPPNFQKIAFDILFNKYTPSAVIVNEHKDIVHFHGDTSQYLRSTPGKPNFNIIKMAREGLDFELRNALLKSKTNRDRITIENIPIKNHEKDFSANIEVIPLKTDEEIHYLILFCKSIKPQRESDEGRREDDVIRIRQLELELEQIREDIRTVTESQEAAIEELQSANEELLSGSEELQTLNEELETSGEELQSNNEELISVNDELMDRQEQLTAARNYAEAIITTIREPLVIMDRNLRVKSANAAFYKCFDTPEIDTEGRLFYELGHGHWNSLSLRKMLEDILPHQFVVENYEYENEFHMLGKRTMLLNARRIVNEKYADPLILLAIEDITKSKLYKDQKSFTRTLEKEVSQRVQELNESKSFLQSILNSTHYGIASYEAIRDEDKIVDFRITYTNTEVPKNFGRTQEDVTGKTCREVYPKIFENGVFEKMVNCMNSGKAEKYDISVDHDGEEMWLTANIEKVANSVTITSKNITKEKNAALHLQAMNKLLANKNKELEQQILSEFSESFASYKTGSEFFEMLVLELANKVRMDHALLGEIVSTENGDIIRCFAFSSLGRIAENFSYSLEGEPCAKVAKGAHVLLPQNAREAFPKNTMLSNLNIEGYIGYPLFDTSGKCIGLIAVLHEKPIRNPSYIESLLKIAAKRCEIELQGQQNEKMLEEKNAELERNNKELESFNYIASHDLKEPLRKIQLFYSRILDRDKKNMSEQSLEYFDSINNAADRMQNLIEALLSYSTASYTNMVFEKTDLNKLLEEVKADLEDMITAKKATIHATTLPKVPVIPFQFRQLLANLISNGIKYSKADEPPVIHITSQTVDDVNIKGKKYLQIHIEDNGIGFDQKYEHKIFELFQRLHGKAEFVGTGIGLAICKKIVTNHKGFINVQSTIGKGSVFTVNIPVKN